MSISLVPESASQGPDDSCSSSLNASINVPEVELFSLVSDRLPQYHLRVDPITQFTGYHHQDWNRALQEDWGLQTGTSPSYMFQTGRSPSVASSSRLTVASGESSFAAPSLTDDQVERTLDFFLLGRLRTEQITRTFDDANAYEQLLDEKYKDLELAAQIGLTLLSKNKELALKEKSCRERLDQMVDQNKQLRHEISIKEELLRIYMNDTDSDPDATGHDLTESELSFSSPCHKSTSSFRTADPIGRSTRPGTTCSNEACAPASALEHLRRRILLLEEDTERLRGNHTELTRTTQDFEEKEQVLVKDCVKQLAEANAHIKSLSESVTHKSEQFMKLQAEMTTALTRNIDLEAQIKQLSYENDFLVHQYEESQQTQTHLTHELSELRDRYDECISMLNSCQDEARRLRKREKRLLLENQQQSWQRQLARVNADTTVTSGSVMAASATVWNMQSKPASGDVNTTTNVTSTGMITSANLGMAGVNPTDPAGLVWSAGSLAFELHDAIRREVMMTHSPHGVAFGDVNRRTMEQARLVNEHSPQGATLDSGLTDSLYTLDSALSTGKAGVWCSDYSLSRWTEASAEEPAVLAGMSERLQKDCERVRQYPVANRRRSRKNSSLDGSCRDSLSVDENLALGSHGDPAMSPQCTSTTPDLVLSSGPLTKLPGGPTSRYATSGISSGTGLPMMYRLPDKLQLVKPLEGSSTLRHWQHLATPDFASALFESHRPGVQHRYDHLMEDNLTASPGNPVLSPPEGPISTDADETGSSSIELDDGPTPVHQVSPGATTPLQSSTFTYADSKKSTRDTDTSTTNSSRNPLLAKYLRERVAQVPSEAPLKDESRPAAASLWWRHLSSGLQRVAADYLQFNASSMKGPTQAPASSLIARLTTLPALANECKTSPLRNQEEQEPEGQRFSLLASAKNQSCQQQLGWNLLPTLKKTERSSSATEESPDTFSPYVLRRCALPSQIPLAYEVEKKISNESNQNANRSNRNQNLIVHRYQTLSSSNESGSDTASSP